LVKTTGAGEVSPAPVFSWANLCERFGRLATYFPFHCGARFSRKADTPSLKSSLR